MPRFHVFSKVHGKAGLLAAALLLLATAWVPQLPAGEEFPVLTADLPEAQVTVKFPADRFAVGDDKPFKVRVKPRAGQVAPKTVRARLGMPMMFHWITEEASRSFASGQELEFPGEYPMYGIYRFRIWLDYADGREVKTAVDFKVVADEAMAPNVVE